MSEYPKTLEAVGHDPPLTMSARIGDLEEREVSLRSILSLCLAGLAAGVLMGMSFPVTFEHAEIHGPGAPDKPARLALYAASFDSVAKAPRTSPRGRAVMASDRRRIDVSSLVRIGDRDVARIVPFVHLRMALDAGDAAPGDYPPFDALDVFAEDGAADAVAPGGNADSRLESEISFRTVDFPEDAAAFSDADEMSDDDAEKEARGTERLNVLASVKIAGFLPVDPVRFGEPFPAPDEPDKANGLRVVGQNISVAGPSATRGRGSFSENTLLPLSGMAVAEALVRSGYDADAERIAAALSSNFFAEAPTAVRALRLGLESTAEGVRIVRASLIADGERIATVARDDRDVFVAARSGERYSASAARAPETAAADAGRPTLTVYDALNRAALAYGLTPKLTRQLIRLLAPDVDYRAALNAGDRLELFFSEADADNRATEASELHFVRFALGGGYGTFYRHRTQDGRAAFFGPEGRGSRAFLLRNPVPNARFESAYGMRRHPILGYVRMHTGVDWSAPAGTPIIAPASGVVEQAGWRGGYGRQTLIRHAHGYVTSYSHQSGFADGVAPGAVVRQGQIIGYVGSTGLSTGSHLHYEVSINGETVDPMRVRAPQGRALTGVELEAFLAERDRTDELLYDPNEGLLRLATNDR